MGLGLVALLVAELIIIAARFDRRTLADDARLWLDLPRLLIAGGTAFLIIGAGVAGIRARGPIVESLEAYRPSRWWWAFGLVHLAVFGLFAWLTDLVFQGGSRITVLASLLYAAWVSAGLATVVLWGAALVRSELWLPLVKRNTWMMAAVAVIGTLAWLAGSAANYLWRPLGSGTLYLSHEILSLFTNDTVYRPLERVVGTSAFEVLIEARCSGYEGIGLVCAFLAVYLYLFRAQLKFPNALLIVPLGALVIWLANSVRIAALIAVGTWVSRTIAEEGFHSQAGWMAFCGVALGLVYLLQSVPFFSKTAEASEVSTNAVADPTPAYLVPLLVLVAVSMATAALSTGFDRLYPVKVLAVAAALFAYRRFYAQAEWACSWHAVGVGCVAFAVWMALEPAGSHRSASALRSSLSSLPAAWANAWLVARFVGFIVTVPVAEELAFRGYLARLLVREEFESVSARSLNWLALTVSSVAFGALHGGRWLAGTAAGLLYALALDRRGRVSDAIVAHAITNALIAAYVLTTGSWSLMV